MRKIIYTLSLIIVVSSMSCSHKTYTNLSNVEGKENTTITQSDEEGAVQEPAWTYYERLSYVFGADSTCVGIRNDMDFPDWYSGCFVNNHDRLTINVVGDTAELRPMLAELLNGNEFDLGIGICPKKEQIRVQELLHEAIASNYKGAMQSSSDEDGTITVILQGKDSSVVEDFKKNVFDSPILRFEIADKVGIELRCDTINVEEKAFVTHESSPQFPGGETAMIEYIYDNLRYPKEAYDENIQGRVVVQFLVDKTGNIDSIKVVRGKDPYLDAEAVRIVKAFPKFTPGKFDLVPINQWMTLPIKFSVSDYKEKMDRKYPAFQYDNGDDYIRDGLYRIVDKRGKIGYADEKGNTIITPRFAFGFPFENGKAKVTDSGQEKEVEGSRGEYHYWESDDWYYIDKTGRRLED
ncbi:MULTISPECIES: TonB family protein [Muribaculaceae]|jgi:TonB family protein|uniref:TonB family protein n=1 Tax=Muribaculaceae TaxID=2005473 RepID=UPI0025B229A2|nr:MULTISPECIES: TonB family protein [Muribaculaceae]